ncbi:Oidioi.mRNA.OKI2018_I69.PAR.g9386.t1.cds [Oikopleura dioica]|uniref:Oidioi.mRNA.OKI2018_I69.PAR.g9386.t1.cds n=1 Tax=Oikopleura dioica TaxID=34765 RepID=A0ABN7RPR2_OIKDI|nr:Oidioi.mRNA.OKI2018_I69.PAR.g9386.t1.cds [Oikopleura dioica]
MTITRNRYKEFLKKILIESKSESCEEGKVRFICPRQNEPREYLYCCTVAENQYTCCADETKSRYFKNSSETVPEDVEQNKTSITGALWQAVIILYIFIVFLIMLADFFSHMRLKNKKSAHKPSPRQMSAES